MDCKIHLGLVGHSVVIEIPAGKVEGNIKSIDSTLSKITITNGILNSEKLPYIYRVYAKDIILALIAREGARGGLGCALEFCGETLADLDVQARMTLCNMAVEFGAWTGVVAPDESVLQWISTRADAPRGAMLDQALQAWRHLHSDEEAQWEYELSLDVSTLEPQVTWGNSVDFGGPITQSVP